MDDMVWNIYWYMLMNNGRAYMVGKRICISCDDWHEEYVIYKQYKQQDILECVASFDLRRFVMFGGV